MEAAVAKAAQKRLSGDDAYLSFKDLARRWSCSRSSADRIVTRAGITRVVLGEGRKAMVRIPLREVVAYEDSRRMRTGDPVLAVL
jgi:hypothetical protein